MKNSMLITNHHFLFQDKIHQLDIKGYLMRRNNFPAEVTFDSFSPVSFQDEKYKSQVSNQAQGDFINETP